MMNNRRRAVTGEQAALDYVKKLGYEIVDRNYICKSGELDLVALDGDTVVVIEVKTRESIRFGSAIESITPTKVRNILSATKYMLSEKKLHGRPFRFDIICVTRGEIEHIKDAFWSN